MRRTNKTNAVTVKDLEREIHDLRVGLGKQTEMMAELSRENGALRIAYDRIKLEKEQIQFTLGHVARQLSEEQGAHRKTVNSLQELIAKMPSN